VPAHPIQRESCATEDPGCESAGQTGDEIERGTVDPFHVARFTLMYTHPCMSARKIPKKNSGNQSLFGEAEASNFHPVAQKRSEKDGAPAASKDEMVVAHVDGGARGNPGPAGY